MGVPIAIMIIIQQMLQDVTGASCQMLFDSSINDSIKESEARVFIQTRRGRPFGVHASAW